MNKQELDRRIERAQNEPFIVVETDQGYRVCSALAPANQWRVTDGEHPVCDCPDFQHHAEDPEWKCKHVVAVENHRQKQNHRSGGDAAGSAIPAAPEPRPPAPAEAKKANHRNNGGAQMLIKRSVSPDGRIDSLSVEFSCLVGKTTSEEIKQQAAKTLKLQSEIVEGFRKSSGTKSAQPTEAPEQNGAVAATLIDVASMKTKFGLRLCINVSVNGETLKLFGSVQELAEAVAAAGLPNPRIQEGVQLNVPCRVITKPNGKYVNIERVLPALTERREHS
jgi:hypothetical protein